MSPGVQRVARVRRHSSVSARRWRKSLFVQSSSQLNFSLPRCSPRWRTSKSTSGAGIEWFRCSASPAASSWLASRPRRSRKAAAACAWSAAPIAVIIGGGGASAIAAVCDGRELRLYLITGSPCAPYYVFYVSFTSFVHVLCMPCACPLHAICMSFACHLHAQGISSLYTPSRRASRRSSRKSSLRGLSLGAVISL